MLAPLPEATHGTDDHHVVGSHAHETEGNRVLKHGDAFLVVDRFGDIQPFGRGEQGLYYRGTRFLSRLRVRFAKRQPMFLYSSVLSDNLVLSVDLANPDMHDGRESIPYGTVHLSRRALLRDGTYIERIHLSNYGGRAARFPLRIEFDADFRDVFEVRGMHRKRRGRLLDPRAASESTRLCYEGLDGLLRVTEIKLEPQPSVLAPGEAVFELELAPGATKTLELTVACSIGEGKAAERQHYESARDAATSALQQEEDERTTVYTSNRHFNRWLDRSRADLRMLATRTEHGLYPYAGVPWYSTVFGRDGIWTALQMLWLDSSFARGVLAFLSAHQAKDFDAEADAEPGKILHELREGEMAALGEIPFGRYYGSIDSTPLYLMLAAAYHRATGDAELMRRIWPNLLLAMEWVERHGDRDGDGFIEYDKRSTHGLVQQGWKDSHDSVFHADGSDAEPPIALCEVQGYAYAARRGMAELALTLGEPERAARWNADADALRARFDEAFWCEDIGMYALALDGKKRPCRVKSSNAGHCLYTGIALPSRLPQLGRQLLSRTMFSGWGVRTIASDERRYNPMSYHNGSVWPHDNAIVAEGLARAGHVWEAAAVLEGMFEASSFMDLQRLPELFCGFGRDAGQEPIRYPVACLPQAWASGTPFALMRAVLGLEIDAIEGRLIMRRPVLPAFIETLEIRRLRVGSESIDLRLVRYPEDVGVMVLNGKTSIEVVVVK